jgi:hypothetical protein
MNARAWVRTKRISPVIWPVWLWKMCGCWEFTSYACTLSRSWQVSEKNLRSWDFSRARTNLSASSPLGEKWIVATIEWSGVPRESGAVDQVCWPSTGKNKENDRNVQSIPCFRLRLTTSIPGMSFFNDSQRGTPCLQLNCPGWDRNVDKQSTLFPVPTFSQRFSKWPGLSYTSCSLNHSNILARKGVIEIQYLSGKFMDYHERSSPKPDKQWGW